MRGIEAAFWGTLGRDPERRFSKKGNVFANLNVAVSVGKGDDGKDLTQWVRVTCFGEVADRIGEGCTKGDRVYVEGSLTISQWVDKVTSEPKSGVNVAAYRCERVPTTGKNRPRNESFRENGPNENRYTESRHEERAFDDEIPF